MDKLKPTDKDLDEIYNLADKLMCKKLWHILDSILEYITEYIWRYDVNLLLAWATVTLAGKNELKNRKEFLDKCKELYSDNTLWNGLE